MAAWQLECTSSWSKVAVAACCYLLLEGGSTHRLADTQIRKHTLGGGLGTVKDYTPMTFQELIMTS